MNTIVGVIFFFPFALANAETAVINDLPPNSNGFDVDNYNQYDTSHYMSTQRSKRSELMTDKRKPAAQEPPVPDAELLSPMLRATVFVRDLEESLKLYRDILGLKPWLERVLDGDRTNRILGTEGKSVRIVILQSGDATTGNVGLFTYDDDQPLPPSRSDIRTGDVAFIFITNDIQGIYERVESAGYTIVSPPMVLFPEESAETQSLEMLFFDRDGIAVNLIQRNVPTTLATD